MCHRTRGEWMKWMNMLALPLCVFARYRETNPSIARWWFNRCWNHQNAEAPLFSKGYSRYIPWSKGGGDVRGQKRMFVGTVPHNCRHGKTPRGFHKHHFKLWHHDYSEIVDINRPAGDSMRGFVDPHAHVPMFPLARRLTPLSGRPLCRRGTPRCFLSISWTCVHGVCAIRCDHAKCTASWQNHPRRMIPYKM